MTVINCSCPLIWISCGPHASLESDAPLAFHTSCPAAVRNVTSLQVPVDVVVRISDETRMRTRERKKILSREDV
jgi:hypothetical protein